MAVVCRYFIWALSPKINKGPKDALLREYQVGIQKLKAMLMGQMAVPADFATGVIFQMV